MKTVITKAPVEVLKLKVGNSAVLFCDATYEKEKLEPSFTWLKNDAAFVASGTVALEKRLTPPSRVMFFNNVKLLDGGEYGCWVYTKDKSSGVIVSEDRKNSKVIVIGMQENVHLRLYKK